MAQVCADRGVQLTFNHQRRFSPEFMQARELLRSGAIGDLVRLEGACGNLFDWGTHWFDMFFFYNDETSADWVLGQVEPRGGKSIFGVQVEGQAISYCRFHNDIMGMLTTSMKGGRPLSTRIVGTDGIIEAALRQDPLRIWARGMGEWQTIELEGDRSLQGTVARGRAIGRMVGIGDRDPGDVVIIQAVDRFDSQSAIGTRPENDRAAHGCCRGSVRTSLADWQALDREVTLPFDCVISPTIPRDLTTLSEKMLLGSVPTRCSQDISGLRKTASPSTRGAWKS